MSKYIDLSKETNILRTNILEGIEHLNEEMKSHIEPFAYDETKTEWDMRASKMVLNLLTGNMFGYSRKEISDLGGEDLPVSRLNDFANTEKDRNIIPIESAKAFVEMVEILTDKYREDFMAEEKEEHPHEDEFQGHHQEH